MKKIMFILTVAAIAYSPLFTPQAQASQGKGHKNHKGHNHYAHHAKRHQKHA
jgi:hypothetical protein